MNRRITHHTLFVLLLVVATALLAACGIQQEGTEPETGGGEVALDGKALAEERCSACHPFSQVESAKKSPDGWKANVERMVAKGAVLNAAEQAAVIEFLSEAYPE